MTTAIELTAGELALIEAKRAQDAAAKAEADTKERIEIEKNTVTKKAELQTWLKNIGAQNMEAKKYFGLLQIQGTGYSLQKKTVEKTVQVITYAKTEDGKTDRDKRIVQYTDTATAQIYHIVKSGIRIYVAERTKTSGRLYSHREDSIGYWMHISECMKDHYWKVAKKVEEYIDGKNQEQKRKESDAEKQARVSVACVEYAKIRFPSLISAMVQKDYVSAPAWSRTSGGHYVEYVKVTVPNGCSFKVSGYEGSDKKMEYSVSLIALGKKINKADYIDAITNLPIFN